MELSLSTSLILFVCCWEKIVPVAMKMIDP